MIGTLFWISVEINDVRSGSYSAKEDNVKLTPEIKLLSSFTHPQVTCMTFFLLNICFCPFSESQWGPNETIFFLTSIVFGKKTTKYIFKSSFSYRFEMTWGWVNDDRMFFFVLFCFICLFEILFFTADCFTQKRKYNFSLSSSNFTI